MLVCKRNEHPPPLSKVAWPTSEMRWRELLRSDLVRRPQGRL